jgi:Ca2+-binding EF-hand superfamily protein
MASKKIILKEIQIVITNPFETPKKVFDFFDKGGNGKISKNSK